MNVIGIDPGLRCTGLATFDGKTWDVRSIRSTERDLAARCEEIAASIPCAPVDLLVIERPQVYQGRLQKGDPNDLVDLAVLVGVLLRHIPHVRALLPRPRDWKGQVPKDIHHRRLRARVPDLGPASKDAMDAVGLALWGWDQRSMT